MKLEKFRIEIPQSKLDELHRRLEQTSWPHDFENDDWRYGVPQKLLQDFVATWRTEFDWRAQEEKMNDVGGIEH